MKRTRQYTIETLNGLIAVPMEQWPIMTKARSANAHGMVNSGILMDGAHFFKRWDYDASTGQHANPRYEVTRNG